MPEKKNPISAFPERHMSKPQASKANHLPDPANSTPLARSTGAATNSPEQFTSFEAAMKVLILYHDHVLASKVNARLDRASTTFSE